MKKRTKTEQPETERFMNWNRRFHHRYQTYCFFSQLFIDLLLQWSYLLAASFVMGGVVWSYFQTPASRQTTYAPVIIIGFGMSVMYVMSMAFVTELIGDDKVCDLGKYIP